MQHPWYVWVIFNAFIITMLTLDLFVFNRNAHEIKVKEALGWTAFWMSLAGLFAGGVYWYMGHDSAVKFITGYLVEESLSVDNLFVFLLIFSFFKVPPRDQHKILFWGIIGVLVMRAAFIATGILLIQKFHWITYVFGAFLLFTGFKLLTGDEKKIEPEKNPVLKLVRKWLPVTAHFEGDRFFVRKDGRLWATPMFIVLLVVETTDLVFAVDSIPAVLSISSDPFIVYTSNIFAILGLRSIFFALSGFMKVFHYLNYGLSAILVFIGTKMLIAHYYKISSFTALAVIVGILALSVVASLMKPQPPESPTIPS